LSTPLPKDATLVELRTDALTFRTRDAVLPGTVVDLVLRLEGQPLALSMPVEACLVMEKDRGGYVYHCRLDLTALPSSDRQIVGLFIGRGRGSPVLAVPGSK
jgi:hypothetical protein